MKTQLKKEIEKVAIENGIHSMEWLGGSLYVKFQGTLPTMSADKTHIALRKIVKKHDADSGVNLYSVGDEWVYDFVPASAEAPYVDYSGEHIPQGVDTQIELECEMARGK